MRTTVSEVATPATTESAAAAARGIYTSSVLAVTALFMIAVAVPAGLAYGWPMGIGLGAMCAFWGGPGFGVMVGGARVELRRERTEAATVAHPTTTSEFPARSDLRLLGASPAAA